MKEGSPISDVAVVTGAAQGIGAAVSERLLADAEHDSRDARDAIAQIIRSAAREATLSDGVNDDGLTTTVFPIRKEGAICQMPIISGQFHGPIAPTTPSGL